MMISNRSLPQIYYLIEHDDGSIEFIVSSRGTDEVVTAQASIIKKNVVANNIINYTKMMPIEGGCDWISVQALDIAGSIPEMLKNKGKVLQAKNAMRQIHLIKTGEAPTA